MYKLRFSIPFFIGSLLSSRAYLSLTAYLRWDLPHLKSSVTAFGAATTLDSTALEHLRTGTWELQGWWQAPRMERMELWTLSAVGIGDLGKEQTPEDRRSPSRGWGSLLETPEKGLFQWLGAETGWTPEGPAKSSPAPRRSLIPHLEARCHDD